MARTSDVERQTLNVEQCCCGYKQLIMTSMWNHKFQSMQGNQVSFKQRNEIIPSNKLDDTANAVGEATNKQKISPEDWADWRISLSQMEGFDWSSDYPLQKYGNKRYMARTACQPNQQPPNGSSAGWSLQTVAPLGRDNSKTKHMRNSRTRHSWGLLGGL